MDRAKGFPVDKIFNDEKYKGKPLIICGHSMGGAVATIVSIIMMNEFEKRTKATNDTKNHLIKCITFGAPYVGDLELKEYCDMRGFSKVIELLDRFD